MENLQEEFGKTLFSQEDIEYVNKEMEENIFNLFGRNVSLDNNDRILQIEKEIEEFKSKKVEKLFSEYENLLHQRNELQNCLAYYLGMRKGMELKKL